MKCSKCGKMLSALRDTIVRDVRTDVIVLCATSDNVYYRCVGTEKNGKAYCGDCRDKDGEKEHKDKEDKK